MQDPYSIPVSVATRRLILISLLLAFAGYAAFAAGHGRAPVTGQPVLLGVLLLLSMLIHEVLHAAGFLRAGIARSHIRFGMQLKTFALYAHTDQPMSARQYRFAVMLPGLLLGVLPSLAGLLTGHDLLFIIGLMQLMGSLGDAYVLWLLRHADSGLRLRDHPTRMGAMIAEPDPVS